MNLSRTIITLLYFVLLSYGTLFGQSFSYQNINNPSTDISIGICVSHTIHINYTTISVLPDSISLLTLSGEIKILIDNPNSNSTCKYLDPPSIAPDGNGKFTGTIVIQLDNYNNLKTGELKLFVGTSIISSKYLNFPDTELSTTLTDTAYSSINTLLVSSLDSVNILFFAGTNPIVAGSAWSSQLSPTVYELYTSQMLGNLPNRDLTVITQKTLSIPGGSFCGQILNDTSLLHVIRTSHDSVSFPPTSTTTTSYVLSERVNFYPPLQNGWDTLPEIQVTYIINGVVADSIDPSSLGAGNYPVTVEYRNTQAGTINQILNTTLEIIPQPVIFSPDPLYTSNGVQVCRGIDSFTISRSQGIPYAQTSQTLQLSSGQPATYTVSKYLMDLQIVSGAPSSALVATVNNLPGQEEYRLLVDQATSDTLILQGRYYCTSQNMLLCPNPYVFEILVEVIDTPDIVLPAIPNPACQTDNTIYGLIQNTDGSFTGIEHEIFSNAQGVMVSINGYQLSNYNGPIYVTATTTGACKIDRQQIINVGVPVSVDINPTVPDSICINYTPFPINIINTSTFSNEPIDTVIGLGIEYINNVPHFNPYLSGAGTYQVEVQYGSNFCQSSVMRQFTVLNLPNILMNVEDTTSNTSYGTNLDSITYVCGNNPEIRLLAGPIGGILQRNGVNLNNPYFEYPAFLPNIEDVYTYTYTDSNNCTNNASLTLRRLAPPNAVLVGDSSICINETSTTFQAINNPNQGSEWQFENISSDADSYTWVVPDSIGDYEIVLIVSDTNVVYENTVCYDTVIHNIRVNPLPQIYWSAFPSDTICQGDSILIQATSTPNTQIWINSTLDSAITVLSDHLGNFYTIRSLDTLTGCESQTDSSFYGVSKPMFSMKVLNDGGCYCDAITLQVDIAPHLSFDDMYYLVLDFGDGLDTIINYPAKGGTYYISHLYAQHGIYTAYLELSNRGVCNTIDSIQVPVTNVVSTPFFDDFENSNNNWLSLDNWVIGEILESSLTSSSNVLHTGFLSNGAPYPNKTQIVYAPCFDIQDLGRPRIHFTSLFKTYLNQHGVHIEYFDPLTNAWTPLGEQNKGVNWYNSSVDASSTLGFSGSQHEETESFYRLDELQNNGITKLRLRFVFAVDNDITSPAQMRGFGIDDFYVDSRIKKALTFFVGLDSNFESSSINSVYNTFFNTELLEDAILVQDPGINPFFNNQNTFNSSPLTTRFGDVVDPSLLVSNDKGYSLSRYDELNLEELHKYTLTDPEFDIQLSIEDLPNNQQKLKYSFEALTYHPIHNYRLTIMVIEDSLAGNKVPFYRNYYRELPLNDLIPREWNKGDVFEDSLTFEIPSHVNGEQLDYIALIESVSDSIENVYYVYSTQSSPNIFVTTSSQQKKQNPVTHTIKIFPNPNQGTFQVDIRGLETSSPIEWKLTNVLGQEFQKGLESDNQFQINSNLPTGIYLLSLFHEDQILGTQKLIIQN